jgi:hypothetical protein
VPLTKPSDSLIMQQANRLLILPNNPGTATELVIALKRHGKTTYHIKGIVNYLLDNQQFFPTPSAVRAAAEICLSEPPPQYCQTDPKCSVCAGTGFSIIAKGEYSGADVCVCRKKGTVQ